MLARTLYHLDSPGRGRKVSPEDRAVLDMISHSFDELDAVLRIYGNAFRDSLNEQTLDRDFYRAAQEMDSRLSLLDREADVLGKLCLAATGRELEPAPELAPGTYEAPLEWKNGRFERGGKPALFYPPIGCRSSDMIERENAHKLLELDNCWSVPMILDRPGQKARADSNTFSWAAFDRLMATYIIKGNPEAGIGIQSPFAMHYLSQICPAWWFEKHKDEPDVLFRDRDGKAPNWVRADKPYAARKLNTHGRYAGGGGYWARLNFWNPEVRKMYRLMLEEWSRTVAEKYPGRAVYFAVGLEGANSAIAETGFNQSAIAAFLSRLKEDYRTVKALNKAWGSNYESFDAIDPRQYSPRKPNGLMFEFQSFRHEGYWDWMNLMKTSLKKYLPDMIFLNDFHNALDRGHRSGMDAPGMFKCYDVVGNHYYGKPATRPVWMHRLLDSLRKAYGTELGNFEWVGDVRCSDIFDQRATKNSALLEMFEQMAWGRSVLSIWYGGSAGFAEGAQYWLPALHQSVLRYSTSYIPIGRLRARRFGEIALTYPTSPPRLAIMEATTSFLNGIDVRSVMREAAKALGKKEWNFGYIYETPLLEGRQSLEAIQTLILPRGICLKPGISKKLLSWIRKGGSLIALLPPGVYGPYGRPDGTLLRTVIGKTDFTLSADFSEMMLTTIDRSRVATEETGDSKASILRADYGKGQLIIYTKSTPFPEDHLLRLVEKTTPRDVWTSQNRFRIVLRESTRHYYLFIVNPDYLQPNEDTVHFSGNYRGAVDLGCEAAFPVKTTSSNATTTFKLRLSPGEGTVIRLDKRFVFHRHK